jgi:dephospho-CoA kinase
MIRIGLTGGMGMGKSTAAEMLRQRGLPVADSDALARQLVEPGQPALAEIAHRFGPEMIGLDGRLRRDLLAERVFSDAARRKELEAILHPRIRRAWLTQLDAWREAGAERGVVVVPLLYEVDAAGEFDRIICVACSTATQAERLRERGWTQEQIRSRQQAQWPVEEKMARAHFVVWSEGGLEVLAAQLERILEPGSSSASQL